MLASAAAPPAGELPAELLTLDYSPLLNEYDQPHSSIPLVMQFAPIDLVFKSSKRKTGDASTQTDGVTRRSKPRLEPKSRAPLVDRACMPPPPPRPPKRTPVKAPVPKELHGDALGYTTLHHVEEFFFVYIAGCGAVRATNVVG